MILILRSEWNTCIRCVLELRYILIEILDDSGKATVRIPNGGSWPAVELPIAENWLQISSRLAVIFITCFRIYIDWHPDIREALEGCAALNNGKTVAGNYVFDVTGPAAYHHKRLSTVLDIQIIVFAWSARFVGIPGSQDSPLLSGLNAALLVSGLYIISSAKHFRVRQNRGFIKDDVVEVNILDSDFCVFFGRTAQHS